MIDWDSVTKRLITEYGAELDRKTEEREHWKELVIKPTLEIQESKILVIEPRRCPVCVYRCSKPGRAELLHHISYDPQKILFVCYKCHSIIHLSWGFPNIFWEQRRKIN